MLAVIDGSNFDVARISRNFAQNAEALAEAVGLRKAPSIRQIKTDGTSDRIVIDISKGGLKAPEVKALAGLSAHGCAL